MGFWTGETTQPIKEISAKSSYHKFVVGFHNHTGFQLVPTAMTSNAVIALILNFFDRIRQIFRPIMSIKHRLLISVFHFWPKL